MLGQQISVNANSDNTNIDLSNLSAGNYFVKVTIEGVSKTIKVLKNKILLWKNYRKASKLRLFLFVSSFNF